ncbi:cell division ATP-binding protein FtsE [Cryobacterium sp. TMT1-21]|uniref:Cell division ATP-binding protein FtsE n=1 Tax=Cryobacterium shii TaxID=1259235 RepID=A0AAQ2HGU8_9MICO|nr:MULTISPECIES: cell division ATP-binding protein FtsE [Cryobacterium]TFC52655.1 cell division ATP-binding protein FtsE [Cryobacterium shii]TFC82175.1 cell division ATP-binding protein FtsE [Cryobacterium sp. TmT2-59]TFD13571.1 cell division ATP-binding protein FtsE [Cryobacterium sp. TMT1-21]TFD17358.1 cell division ATP-binding protein FtsE [Cryobacterium sp. TMT2-23]TFD20372.1 cell division ATP-binding protein FtsE [Cryobacterium sp. TMT4-10]
MIRFDTITKQYPGTNRPALDAISVEILRGEFVFLVGASGSGKSTCLRLVLKEDKPTSGSIHVLGQDLRSISNRKVPYFRRNLGVVFQDFRLLPNKSVFDNVAFSLQVIGKSRGYIQEAVPDTLEMVGLAEKAQRLPHELSGGEQQRVAIARAIVNKPQVLLADEPTGNLDPTTSAGIMALLERINAGGTTVVMATHEAGIVDQMQRRVIELAAGKIVRDERQGGYATSAIPTVMAGTGRRSAPAASVFAPAASAPLVHPAAAEPAVLPPGGSPAEPATEPVAEPATVRAAQPPRFFAPVPVPLVEAREAARQAVLAAADRGRTGTQAHPVQSTDSSNDTAQGTGTDAADGGPAMTRPALSTTQHDVPEQLTLAEKLGLRAPGEKPDQTGEQNVGPTR